MMTTPVIRPATADDLEQIVGLLAQLSLDVPREDLGPPLPDTYGRTLEAILADPRQHLLVSNLDGRLVATAVLVVVTNLSYRARPYGIIENIVVDAGMRGRGVGEAIVRRAVDLAREAGCYKVSLTTYLQRVDSHRFYARLGFKQTHLGFRIDFEHP